MPMLKSCIKETKTVLMTVKVTEREQEVFRRRAESLTRGNVSEFAREAMKRWAPKKRELTRKKA